MNFSNELMKSLLVFVFVFFAQNIFAQENLPVMQLPAGTKISCRMDNEISSKFSRAGDTFTASVSEPVSIRDVVVLPAGSKVFGKIVGVRSASGANRGGVLEIAFDEIAFAGGFRRELDASLVTAKKPRSGMIRNVVTFFGLAAIGAVGGAVSQTKNGALAGAGIGAGIGSVAILVSKGKEQRIAAESVFEIVLNKPLRIPVEDF